MLPRIDGFLDFVYRPVFQEVRNTAFGPLNMFPSSGEGKESPTLLDPLERANLNHWLQKRCVS
jgi:hypothetical protein